MPFAIDTQGIRRFIAEGDEIPEGWTPEPEDKSDKPKAAPKPKSKAS